MALSKLRSESLDLTDDYAFTGTVTGAGGGAMQFISKTAISTSSSIQDFTNLFSATYNHYKLILDIVGEDTGDSDISHSWQFLKASDGTVDTTADIDFIMHGFDSDSATGRSQGRQNNNYFNFLYNTVEDTKPSYYEMNIYAPFASEFTTVSALLTYMVNNNTNVVSSNGGAIRANTTSYSGLRLICTSANSTSAADAGSSATGTMLVYGIRES